jgi:hypothetical protein
VSKMDTTAIDGRLDSARAAVARAVKAHDKRAELEARVTLNETWVEYHRLMADAYEKTARTVQAKLDRIER